MQNSFVSFCACKQAFALLEHHLSNNRQQKNGQTWPKKRCVCIITCASVLVMATHPELNPLTVDAAGACRYGSSLEGDSAGTER